MRVKSTAALVILIALVCAVGTVPAFADWEPGDPALHYQLPDPTGWDVYSEWGTGPLHEPPEGYGAANDWTAGVTAPITDIHFWGSWKADHVGETGKILLQIFSNDTISGGDGSFARPDELLWSRVITTGEYTNRLYITGNQGWYDPRGKDTWNSLDHNKMYQYNIPTIEDPFIQQAGQTYWLEISMDFQGCEWGWKTTEDVAGGSSVFWDSQDIWGPHPYWHRYPEIEWKWTQLSTPDRWQDPRTPLDLAFVITPEPATLLLFAMGAAAVLRRRRR